MAVRWYMARHGARTLRDVIITAFICVKRTSKVIFDFKYLAISDEKRNARTKFSDPQDLYRHWTPPGLQTRLKRSVKRPCVVQGTHLISSNDEAKYFR